MNSFSNVILFNEFSYTFSYYCFANSVNNQSYMNRISFSVLVPYYALQRSAYRRYTFAFFIIETIRKIMQFSMGYVYIYIYVKR